MSFVGRKVQKEKDNKSRTKVTVTRSFRVFDENNNLIFEATSAKEVMKKFDMNTSNYLYKFKNTGEYFKPHILSEEKIRIDYVKTKTTTVESKEEPFVIPESKRETIESLPGEIWKSIPGIYEGNMCSNLGRFKIVDSEGNERFSPINRSVNRTKRLYRDVRIYMPGKEDFYCRTSRVLARTFLDETLGLLFKDDRRIVDHIEDKFNEDGTLYENIDNLQILTSKENSRKAVYEEHKEYGRPKKSCVAYNVKTEEVREYETTAKLSEDIWGSNNAGYFNAAYKAKSTTRDGWKVGFSLDEIKQN